MIIGFAAADEATAGRNCTDLLGAAASSDGSLPAIGGRDAQAGQCISDNTSGSAIKVSISVSIPVETNSCMRAQASMMWSTSLSSCPGALGSMSVITSDSVPVVCQDSNKVSLATLTGAQAIRFRQSKISRPPRGLALRIRLHPPLGCGSAPLAAMAAVANTPSPATIIVAALRRRRKMVRLPSRDFHDKGNPNTGVVIDMGCAQIGQTGTRPVPIRRKRMS